MMTETFDIPFSIDNLRFFGAAARNHARDGDNGVRPRTSKLDTPGTARRGRLDLTLELSDEHGCLEAGAFAGRRQYRYH